MTFRRINDTTINCIISPEDLRSRGIKIDDLLERKEEAMNYLRETIVEAARREHFNLESQYSSMRISILPDHSISLTLTEGGKPVEKAAKKEHIPYDQPYTPAASEQSKKQEPQKKEFCFALHSIIMMKKPGNTILSLKRKTKAGHSSAESCSRSTSSERLRRTVKAA